MKYLWDVHSHCHLEFGGRWNVFEELFAHKNTRNGIERLALMGCEPDDWPLVEQVYHRYPDKIIPCFGLHPWLVYKLHVAEFSTQNWQDVLIGLLQKYPKAVVGECGLDRVATTPDTMLTQYPYLPRSTFDSVQKQVFEKHFEIASEMQRPLSIHLVKAEGYFMDFIRDKCKRIPSKRQLRQNPEEYPAPDSLLKLFPPAIMMHSFGGSLEMIHQLTHSLPAMVSKRIWFSFSATINSRSSSLFQRIQKVPDNRLLIESDVNMPEQIDEALDNMLNIVAEAKGWSKDEASERLHMNSNEFFGNHNVN